MKVFTLSFDSLNESLLNTSDNIFKQNRADSKLLNSNVQHL